MSQELVVDGVKLDQDLLAIFYKCTICKKEGPCEGCLNLALAQLKKGHLTQREARAYRKALRTYKPEES